MNPCACGFCKKIPKVKRRRAVSFGEVMTRSQVVCECGHSGPWSEPHGAAFADECAAASWALLNGQRRAA